MIEDNKYRAKVYRASNINEYGSNIRNNLEELDDITIDVVQESNVLDVFIPINDEIMHLNATVRGKNDLENMLYFDTKMYGTNKFELLTFTYIQDFSPGLIIAQEFINLNKSSDTVLQIIFKSLNQNNEYYFVEIFDYKFDNFDNIISASKFCMSDFWVMKEFKPISKISGNVDTDYYGLPSPNKYYVMDEYTYLGETIYARLEYHTTLDCYNIPIGGAASWIASIGIDEKYTTCPNVPELGDDDAAPLRLRNISCMVKAPKNCAFNKAEIDGQCNSFISVPKILSASIGVSYGGLSAYADIGRVFTDYVNIDINTEVTTYDNSDPSKLHKALSVEFDSNKYLVHPGQYFAVDFGVRDYGDTKTAENPTYCRWTVTWDSWESQNSRTLVLPKEYSVKVG